MAEYIIQESTLVEIADAIRAKTGSSEAINVGNLADTINNLPEGGTPTKTTKTIYLDWSGDLAETGWIEYISNNEVIQLWAHQNIEVIEVEGGMVKFPASENYTYSNNFILFSNDVLVAKQDNETIYIVTGDEQ